jgi:hypothetical protein
MKLEELQALSGEELERICRAEGYTADTVKGMDRADLAAKLHMHMLLQSPDEYPLPLYSTCWQQLCLRGAVLAVMLFRLGSHLDLAWDRNVACLLLVVAALAARNARLRKEKAEELWERKAFSIRDAIQEVHDDFDKQGATAFLRHPLRPLLVSVSYLIYAPDEVLWHACHHSGDLAPERRQSSTDSREDCESLWASMKSNLDKCFIFVSLFPAAYLFISHGPHVKCLPQDFASVAGTTAGTWNSVQVQIVLYAFMLMANINHHAATKFQNPWRHLFVAVMTAGFAVRKSLELVAEAPELAPMQVCASPSSASIDSILVPLATVAAQAFVFSMLAKAPQCLLAAVGARRRSDQSFNLREPLLVV